MSKKFKPFGGKESKGEEKAEKKAPPLPKGPVAFGMGFPPKKGKKK